MNIEAFNELTKNRILFLDGATGSNLTKAGMPKGVSTEKWAIEHADVVTALQEAYIEAGSDIIYAPTFSANRISLKTYGLEDKVSEYNAKLAKISIDAAKGRALVAGDITTTGKLLEPLGEMPYEELFDAYKEQITALSNAGVDLLIAETMMCVDEMMAAVDAAMAVCDLPIMCTMTVEADGSGFFGGNIIEAVESLGQMGAAAVGVNCSLGPDQLQSVVSSMKKNALTPVIVKPNAGMPTINDKGEAIYHMTADAFAGHMESLVCAGADIIGGCCGTDPTYIKRMKEIIHSEKK